MLESQALVARPVEQPRQMLTKRLAQHVSSDVSALLVHPVLYCCVVSNTTICQSGSHSHRVTQQAVAGALCSSRVATGSTILCAQLYGDSMRYKPEDAVVLRAMQDMKPLDDHTGSGVPLLVQNVCAGQVVLDGLQAYGAFQQQQQ